MAFELYKLIKARKFNQRFCVECYMLSIYWNSLSCIQWLVELVHIVIDIIVK